MAEKHFKKEETPDMMGMYNPKSMDELKYIAMPAKKLKYNRWLYEFSRILDRVSMRFNKRHPYLTRFEDF